MRIAESRTNRVVFFRFQRNLGYFVELVSLKVQVDCFFPRRRLRCLHFITPRTIKLRGRSEFDEEVLAK